MACAAIPPGSVLAASGEWRRPGGGHWSHATNWTSAPVFPNGTSDVAVFASSLESAATVIVDGHFTVGTLHFDSDWEYTLSGSGGSLTLADTSGVATISTGNAEVTDQFVAVPLVFASDVIVRHTNARPLTLSGAISGVGDLTIEADTIEIVRLAGENTYSGQTTVERGVLEVRSAAALGSTTAGTDVRGGGTLRIYAQTPEPIAVHAGGRLALAGGVHYGGPFTLRAGGLLWGLDGGGTLTTPLPLDEGATTVGASSSSGVGATLTLGAGAVGVGDLVFKGQVNVDAPVRTPGKVLVQSGRVRFNAPDTFDGRVEVGGTFFGWLDVNDDMRFETLRIVSVGGVGTAPGKTLGVASGFVDLAGGRLNARLADGTVVRKTGAGEAVLENLANYPGAILVEQGRLFIEGAAEPAAPGAPPIRMIASDGSSVRLRSDVYRDIDLNDARGERGIALYNSAFAPRTLHGALHLGDHGSSVGGEFGTGLFRLAGTISGGDLTIGGGYVQIAGNGNTYGGVTRVTGPAVLLLADGGTLGATSGLRIDHRSSLLIDNRPAAVADRVGRDVPVSVHGGYIELHAGTETVGRLSLGGASNVRVNPTEGGALTFQSTDRAPGAVLTVAGVPHPGTSGRPGRVFLSTPVPSDDGILPPWMVVGDEQNLDFAAYDAATGLRAFAGYDDSTALATPASNLAVVSAHTLEADRTINALKVESQGALSLGWRRLEIDSGGIIALRRSKPDAYTIRDGTILPGPSSDGELIIHAPGEHVMSVRIVDGDRPTRLTVNGQTLRLRGRSEYTGTTTVVRGTVHAETPDAVPVNGDFVLDGGGYSLSYASPNVTDLGKISIMNGGSLGGGAGAAVEFDAINIDSGLIGAKLAGSGSIVKRGTGRAQITADNSGYTGIIEIDGGELSSRRTGTGTGLVRINAGAIFDTRFGTITPIQLNGGTYYGPNVGDDVDAPVHVSADSLLGSATLAKELRIDAGVTLRTGLVNLAGPVATGPGATVVATAGNRLNVGINADLGGETREVRVVVEPGGKLMLHGRQHLGRLDVAGGTATVSTEDERTLHTKSLDVRSGGVLDLNVNDLIVQATATTRDAVLDDVTAWIRTGRAGGTWAGTGITSTAAARDRLTGLAAILNPGLATFSGEAIDENAILVKYTYNGDANLDGIINADDYFRIDQGLLAQRPSPTYRDGDFNYDGTVNADDYFLIDQAFLGQSAALSLMAVVPEPGSFAATVAVAAGLLRRRPRRRGRPATL